MASLQAYFVLSALGNDASATELYLASSPLASENQPVPIWDYFSWLFTWELNTHTPNLFHSIFNFLSKSTRKKILDSTFRNNKYFNISIFKNILHFLLMFKTLTVNVTMKAWITTHDEKYKEECIYQWIYHHNSSLNLFKPFSYVCHVCNRGVKGEAPSNNFHPFKIKNYHCLNAF